MVDPLVPLVQLLQVGFALGAAWLAALVVLAVAGRLPGTLGRAARSVARRVAPVALHGLLGLAVGTVSLAAPAAAAERPAPPAVSLDWPGLSPSSGTTPAVGPSATVSASPIDTEPTSPAATAALSPAPPPSTAPSQPAAQPTSAVTPTRVVVRPGDSLWGLAARDLGPDATSSRIAQEWPRWWAANRVVIGDDPDLIHPGSVLDRPARDQETS